MSELRCPNPHPRFAQPCDALLLERFELRDGLIQLTCWRCHQPVVVDRMKEGTVDKSVLVVAYS